MNATVTVDYATFQSIKEKADKLDKAKRDFEKANEEERAFVERICTCIEKANECQTLEHKQYYIAQGIRAICEHWDMDMQDNYGELDEGQAPGAG